ncbi:MAG: GDCCVxC domain-containing (seleno)protein [Cyanobacteriota bacterium]
MILESNITCPFCSYEKIEIMPTYTCLFFYTCQKCETKLKPKTGDCCVFCSYGSISCPSIQSNKCC